MEMQSTGSTVHGNVSAREQHPVEMEEERAAATLNQATERVNFHRSEMERWTRLARASGAALVEIRSAEPQPEYAPESFLPDAKTMPSPERF